MKNLTNLVLKLSIMISTAFVIGLNSGNISAQCNFIPAVKVETPIGPNNLAGSVQNTGNDSRKALIISGSMTVHVWDGNSPGFGWDDGTNSGFDNLPSGAYDPDVAIVEAISAGQIAYTWFAIVVYANSNNKCKYRIYEWDLSTSSFTNVVNNFIVNGNQFANGNYGNAINIDADAGGNFVIVYDDPVYPSTIQVIGGTASSLSSATPALCQSNSYLLSGTQQTSTQSFLSPDVSLNWDPNNLTSVVNYTYLSLRLNSGSLYSYVYEMSNDFVNDVCSGTNPSVINVNFVNVLQNSSDYYGRPRIACPNDGSNTGNTDWSVAVMKVTSGGADIVNYTNSQNSIQAAHVYTDSTIILSCSHISGIDPAISYDANYSGIIVGWNTNFSGANNYNQNSMVIANCSLDGRINSSCYSGGVIDYMVIPSDNLTYTGGNDVYSQVHLSISGRDNSDMEYTFYDYIYRTSTPNVVYVDNVMFKPVGYCDQNNFSLRHGKSSGKKEGLVFPNPFIDQLKVNLNNENLDNENLILKLLDASGNILLNAICKKEQINNILMNEAGKINKGIYLIKIDSESKGEIINQKLIKM